MLFIIAMFAMAKDWKQSRCVLLLGLVKEIEYIHTMEFNAEVKEKIIL
jgi:hypothetical protein